LFIRNLHGSLLSRDAIRATRPVWLAVIVVILAQSAYAQMEIDKGIARRLAGAWG
jgi:hypothetical protein